MGFPIQNLAGTGTERRRRPRTQDAPHEEGRQGGAEVLKVLQRRHAARPRALDLGFGRVVGSDAEAPLLLVNLVWSGRATVQRRRCGRALP